MLLRYLVSNWVRQTAEQRVREALSTGKDEADSAQGASPDASGPSPPAEIVCAFALGAEAGGLVDLLSGCVTSRCARFVEHVGDLRGRRVAVIETGVGQEAAREAVRDVINIHQPEWVVSAGFAGALIPEVRRGQMVMPRQIINTQSEKLAVGLQIDQTQEQTGGLHCGSLLTVDTLVRTRERRQQLADEFSAVACDMESFAVADACRQDKVKFLSVRIISDSVDDELPAEIERLLDQDSLASRLGAATGAIFQRPSSIKDMWNLKEQALRASDRLAKFLAQTVEQLPVASQ